MSVNNFIPALWSGAVLGTLKNNLVYKNLTNQNYEGEIKNFGDSVVINQIGSVNTITYIPNVTVLTFPQLQTADQTLKIDQNESFSFSIDDVDSAQVKNKNGLRSQAMIEAGYSIENGVDQRLASHYSEAGIKNGNLGTEAAPLEITADGGGSSIKASVWLALMRERMTQNNVAPENRKLIVPPDIYTKFLLEKITLPNDQTEIVYKDAIIARIFGFEISESNNVSATGSTYRVMASNQKAITFASQLVGVEAFRLQTAHGDAVKGLYVYGSKVIRSDSLLCSRVTVGAEGQ